MRSAKFKFRDFKQKNTIFFEQYRVDFKGQKEVHTYKYLIKHGNKDLLWKTVPLCTYAKTYHLVTVVELQHNIRGAVSNTLGLSVNLNVIENQSLVPGWVQCCPQLLCCLANMQEGDVSIWICEGEKKYKIK